MDFKTLSLNTRGYTQRFRDYLFHNLLFDADIFCFQELQIPDASSFRSFAEKWRGSCFWSAALGKQGGIMTCFSDSFDYDVIQLPFPKTSWGVGRVSPREGFWDRY